MNTPTPTTFLPGLQYRIRRFRAGINREYKHKLLSMGLLPKQHFAVIRRAPLGNTIEIRIGDCALSVRSHELAYVECEAILP